MRIDLQIDFGAQRESAGHIHKQAQTRKDKMR